MLWLDVCQLTPACACLAATAAAGAAAVADTTAAAAVGRYASFDYEEGPQRAADLTLLELLVNGRAVDALARLVPSSECFLLSSCVKNDYLWLVEAFLWTAKALACSLVMPCAERCGLLQLTSPHGVVRLLLLVRTVAGAGDATRIGRTLASRLKELLDRQQYEVIIQVRGWVDTVCVLIWVSECL